MPDPKVVKEADLKENTVHYNGVQFGGGDAAKVDNETLQMMPPPYSVAGQYVYDDADRTITHTRYTLTLQTVMFGSSGNMATTMDILRERLSQSGKILKIKGLGFGFDDDPIDIVWGPKPRSFQAAPVGGDQAWEIIWTCEFNHSECLPKGANTHGRFMAFNFSTSYSHDTEGIETRTITGYVQVSQNWTKPQRKQKEHIGKTPAFVVDMLRMQKRITVDVPFCFRRITNQWRDNLAKNRLEFAIVDQQMSSDPPPVNMTRASGEFSWSTSGDPGFAKGVATLSTRFTVAPGVPKTAATPYFLYAEFAKQGVRGKALGKKGTVIPVRISVRHQLWTRTTDYSMSWAITGCLLDLLGSSGIWEPIPGTNMIKWQASMKRLWGPEGVSGLGSSLQNEVVINTCSEASQIKILQGQDTKCPAMPERMNFKYACQDIPPEKSWLFYDIDVSVVRQDPGVFHRFTNDILEGAKKFFGSNATPEETELTGPNYKTTETESSTDSSATDSVYEQNGEPKHMILLQFKGLRIQHKPQMPTIESIGGVKVKFKSEVKSPAAKQVFDFGCPVYYERAAALYEIPPGEYIPTLKEKKNPSLCDSDGMEGEL